MATRDCDFRLWSYYSLQVKKRDYNIDLKLQYRGPALQLDYNPGDAITTGGNTRSALQLSGCSGDEQKESGEGQTSRNHTGFALWVINTTVEPMTRPPVVRLIAANKKQYGTALVNGSTLESDGGSEVQNTAIVASNKQAYKQRRVGTDKALAQLG